MIEFQNVSKVFQTGVFKRKLAVKDLSFKVESGGIVGLLGPNGSGKSTSLKMLLGFLKPTQGQITIDNFQPQDKRAKSLIGYLPENPKFPRYMTGEDALSYYGRLLGMEKKQRETQMSRLFELVNLERARNQKVQGYSKGMTQRLAIAQALLNDPKVLVMDEPMSGLDPVGRIEIRGLMNDIHRKWKETTILFSTHILSDVEALCQSVLLLQSGQLARQCSLRELLESGGQQFDLRVSLESSILEDWDWLDQVEPFETGYLLKIGSLENLHLGLETLKQKNIEVLGVESRRASLENTLFVDAQYQRSTGKGARP